MRVLIELDGQRSSVDLDRWQGSATLADLLQAVGAPAAAGHDVVHVDDTAVPVSTPLSELPLLEGTRIARTPRPRRSTVSGWSVTLGGGLSAGRVVEVPRHRQMVVGRSPQADLVLPTVSGSWHHCTLELEADGVRVRDAGSTNGTVVAGEPVDADGVLVTGPTTVLAGGSVLLVRPHLEETLAPAPGSLRNLTPAFTAPFNRPPRPGRPAQAGPVLPPTRKEVPPASRFSYVTVLAPLVLAAAMVMIMGDARYALFAALSPVMAVGMYVEQARRRSKGVKEEEQRFAEEVAAFRSDVARAAAAEQRRRWEIVPDPATVMRRAVLPTTRLWQRRADADDFLALHAGTGDVPWRPPVDDRGAPRLDDAVRQVLDDSRMLAAPVTVDLTDAGVVGIVGDRPGALALARSLLVQAAVHCGPADLTVGVFCDAGREDDWAWASWLPHTRQAGAGTGQRWMSSDRQASTAMLGTLRDKVDELPTPAMLVVLDSEVLTEGRDAPARALLGRGRSAPGAAQGPHERPRRVAGIVLAASEEQLPAACTTVVVVDEDAAATVHHPENLTRVEDIVVAGVDLETAEECATSLARFDDPELVVPGAALPSLVRLPALLGASRPDSRVVRSLWSSATGVSTPIGRTESGVLTLDLVADGPHGLVGGTTGSGKSEFLRSLVAGLAARNDPTRLNFILVDFKGGAAFKACERLPHTIGTISNLDEQLAERALRALEAEMERRQRLFAQAGPEIDTLDAYLATNPVEPMPRLLLVVDEFAMLAKDFPDVLSSLVSVAAVGRTLGVHMILATQRPAGVVNDDILANTNLRVALRVQSRDDSVNVVGVPAAAGINRSQQGRAYVKLGQDEIVPVQTALVTGHADERAAGRVEVRETDRFGVLLTPSADSAPRASDTNDLDLLIDAIRAANAAEGFAPPRRVWPEPLGERVPLDGLAGGAPRSSDEPRVGGVRDGVITVALADEPEMQRQVPAGWDLRQGNLLLMGIPGSGTTTALASIALSVTAQVSPQDLDLLVLDLGSGGLAPLAALPHTVAYVGTGPGAQEEQARFLRHLRTELDRRRADPASARRALVLLDGLAALRDEHQDYEGQQLLDLLYRAYADGPALGLSFAVATNRAKAVPSAMDEVTTQKWLFRLADPYDYASLGVRGTHVPAPVPGRFVDAVSRRQMHVATPGEPLDAAVQRVAAAWPDAPRKGAAIRRLPEQVRVSELGARPVLDGEPWLLPVGVAEDDLSVARLEVYEGEHVLVAGPARSGKSTLLLALAESLRGAGPGAPAVWGVCDRRSPLASAPLDRVAVGADDVPALIAGVRMHRGPLVLLVDDAERFEDADQSIASLLAADRPQLCVVAAGRSADLRAAYGHWTRAVRKSRCGVLLQPDVDYDGELLGVALPRRAPVAMSTGRGYACVGGVARLVQSTSPGR
ncbi:cell division protein FtsK [Xylanimonas oleitrophica]|uniref:Cell division protein FtsK n=1 Tax=Xylanimonas oleitrophica TaxID=2607479 RepID=A0A2W5YGB0_9MICO|nr:FtsK/SpoIIIE domain-containing protein [Xylanimonas oleitrophica]PZR53731.1 cell division protein FtsK [Xylanimonas oleitrophica]